MCNLVNTEMIVPKIIFINRTLTMMMKAQVKMIFAITQSACSRAGSYCASTPKDPVRAICHEEAKHAVILSQAPSAKYCLR